MSFADLTDVTAAYEGTITNERFTRALLEEADVVITSRLGDLYDWANTPQREVALRLVLARMVRRVLRNPQGLKSEADGDYSYTTDARVASGSLWLTDEDLNLLGLGGRRVGSIQLGTPYRADA